MAGATWHVAWFEPEHHIVELNAPFFRDRFANMRWSILTPTRCVHWDGNDLSFTAWRSEIRSAERGYNGRTLAHLLQQYF
jgi:DNA polymerase